MAERAKDDESVLMADTEPSDNGMPSVVNTLLTLVDQGEPDQVQVLLNTGNHDKALSDCTWDLVPLLCTHLNVSVQTENPYTVKCCEIIFDRLCQVSKPKELILVLLEQCGAFVDDVKFKVLLIPIQKCLLSLTVKRSHSLSMALDTLQTHIQALPLPEMETQNLTGNERTLLHMDPAVRRINNVLTAMIDFLDPFVENAACGTDRHQDYIKERTDLINTLVKILNHPLMHLDLSQFDEENDFHAGRPQNLKRPTKETTSKVDRSKTPSEGRVNFERIVNMIGKLQPDYLKLVNEMEVHNVRRQAQLVEIQRHVDESVPELENPDDYDVDEEIPPGGIACLVYGTLGEVLGMTQFPCVYSKQYVLEWVLPFATVFLEKPVPFLTEKGVKLMTTAVQNITDESLGAELLELESLLEVIKCLTQVVVHSPSKEIRQAALRLFPLILTKFNAEGRHFYLQYLLNKANHPGLLGFVIGMLKDQIDLTLKQDIPSEYFVGLHLVKLLNYVYVLPEGAQSDLLEESDRVMSALNLLRYLVLRDNPTANKTGAWDSIRKINRTYCDMLRTGLNMSRAHYKLELDKTKAGEYLQKVGDTDMEVTVGNEKIPNLNKDQQIHVLKRALITFDMMDSALARVAELIDQQEKHLKLCN